MKKTRVRRAIAAAVTDWAAGVKYKFGAKPSIMRGSLATEMDCSGAVKRWVALAGVTKIVRGDRHMWVESWDGSVQQWEWCKPIRVEDPVAYALGEKGIGCLLFIKPKRGRPGHVALSLGHGQTIECRGGRGVTIVQAEENCRRGWDDARKLPELFKEVG